MQKRLFLHIGMPKCATTTLQAYLADHVAELAQRGVHYDFEGHVSARGNATSLANAILQRDGGHVQSLLDLFLRRDADIILSSEDLFGVARGDTMRSVADRMRQAGFDITVICYFRRQDIWIESDYKQHVKSQIDWRKGIGALIEHRMEKEVLNYNWTLANWAKAVGRENIVAIPLRPGQAPDYPVRSFLDLVGCSDFLSEGTVAPMPQNVSPPTGLIEPARFLKKAMLDRGMSPVFVKRQVAQFFEQVPKIMDIPPRRFLMPIAKRRKLLQRFENVNAAFEKNFFDGKEAFDKVLQKDPASESPLGAEAAEILAAYHLEFQPGLRLRAGIRRRVSGLWHATRALSRS
ncbi:hypothetical protein [uncultured Roseovarius sp.]|uniref:hypothetical protein n=1 Tax=uncultured Roseovarius sp. TaxID=293344 RepID=UPI00260DB854|nr:hypothetical protein [uncultured Roseovarius sp.]